MTRILVAYGTTDGHTAKIAETMAGYLRAEGCAVDIFGGTAVTDQLDPREYDGVVVAASVHAGGYQRPVKRWIARHFGALNNRPGMFLSVCLAVLEKNSAHVREAESIMNDFLAKAGWRPEIRRLVAGALPYTRYGWLKRLIMVRISRKAGGDTDTSRDYEYTDWEALKTLTHEFTARLTQPDRVTAATGPVSAFAVLL